MYGHPHTRTGRPSSVRVSSTTSPTRHPACTRMGPKRIWESTTALSES
jgi:hypothetical protein